MDWRPTQIALAALVIGLTTAPAPWADDSPDTLPAAPEYYVLDEPRVLTEMQKQALSTILIEHDQATGEQIFVAILKRAGETGAERRAHEIFEGWQVGKRGADDGALIAVFQEDREAVVRAGYGLHELGESETRGIAREAILPELRRDQPYRAVGLGTIDLLRVIGSPLIESGRAQSLLQQGGLPGAPKPLPRREGSGLWWGFVAAGVLLLCLVFHSLIAAEAHFTGGGWFKPRPWRGIIKGWRPHNGPVARTGGFDGRW